ncbi:MAG: hypothetical protein FWG39_03830 [Alphaproteobacteria bacterium]|nr:hypothetical protein [Alphaproteobacteria bacterium]
MVSYQYAIVDKNFYAITLCDGEQKFEELFRASPGGVYRGDYFFTSLTMSRGTLPMHYNLSGQTRLLGTKDTVRTELFNVTGSLYLIDNKLSR